jgi:hypothetical protein
VDGGRHRGVNTCRTPVTLPGCSPALPWCLALKYTIGLRVDGETERTGIDEAEHAEAGYELTAIFTGSGSPNNRAAALPSSKVPASAGQEG